MADAGIFPVRIITRIGMHAGTTPCRSVDDALQAGESQTVIFIQRGPPVHKQLP